MTRCSTQTKFSDYILDKVIILNIQTKCLGGHIKSDASHDHNVLASEIFRTYSLCLVYI